MANIVPNDDVNDIHIQSDSTELSHIGHNLTAHLYEPKKNSDMSIQTVIADRWDQVAKIYTNLSPAYVAVWEDYARMVVKHNLTTGKMYNPPASAIFIDLAIKYLQVNPTGAIPLTPPKLAFVGDKMTIKATGSAGEVTFCASASNSEHTVTELLVQSLKTHDQLPSSADYCSKGFVAFGIGALASNMSVPQGIYAPAYRFINIQTGQETVLVLLPIIQVS